MTPAVDHTTEAVQAFGYTAREAAFLRLAALHSGYFLRRQYLQFLGASRGYADDVLIEKAIALRHVTVVSSLTRTKIYHVVARPLYHALVATDSRHRRPRSPLAMQAKLMGLDFVLSHRAHQYLHTEADKLTYFRETRGLDRSVLPTKTYRSPVSGASTDRYFVDKFPVFLSAARAPSCGHADACVSFCYVDPGEASASSFLTHLRRYRQLFAALGAFDVVYIAARLWNIQRAQHTFAQFCEGRAAARGRVSDAARDYFQLRDWFEQEAYGRLGTKGIYRLKAYREGRFSALDWDDRYRAWKRAQDADGVAPPAANVEGALRGGVLSTYRPHHRYACVTSLDGQDTPR